jgi:MinD-like ATPase involved in chromosome partitioning or flagellar assembly
MHVVTFYSFKGGVGRSLCLLNVAYHFARNKGQRVGLLDLDIEASGLSHMLRKSVRADRDLLHLLEPGNRDVSLLEQYVLDVSFDDSSSASCFLLPTVADSILLDRLVWDLATHRFLSSELLPAFARLYHLDYILVDARSGLAASSTSALKLADLEVLVCRLDIQNRYGIKRLVEVCRAASRPFRVVVSACPKQGQRDALKSFEKEIEASVNCLLPYEPRLYYEELILSHTEPKHPLSRLYGQLAADIMRFSNDIQQS